MAGATRIELATSGVTGRRSNQLNYAPGYPWNAKNLILFLLCLIKHFFKKSGGRNRDRTCDIRLVRPTLSQLSYPPGEIDLLSYE